MDTKMKSFNQFQEDIEQLKKDLGDLERQTAASDRLSSRRHDAKRRIKNIPHEFSQKVQRKREEDEERKEIIAQKYAEKKSRRDNQ